MLADLKLYCVYLPSFSGVSHACVSTLSTSSAVLGDVCDASSYPPDVCDISSFPPLNVSTGSVSDVRGVQTTSSSGSVSTSSVSTDVRGVTNASSTNTLHSSAVSLEKYTCVQCAVVCKSKQALHMHHIRFQRKNNVGIIHNTST